MKITVVWNIMAYIIIVVVIIIISSSSSSSSSSVGVAVSIYL